MRGLASALIAPPLLIYVGLANLGYAWRRSAAEPRLGAVHAVSFVLGVAIWIGILVLRVELDESSRERRSADTGQIMRRLRGAVTVTQVHAREDQFEASVVTRVGATFAVMAGACDSAGETVLGDVRRDEEPRRIQLADGDRADIRLELQRRSQNPIAGWFFEIDAMDGYAALAQQIYSSGPCLRHGPPDLETGPLYLPLPAP